MRILARGRDADVFDAGSGRVLRRFRNPSRTVGREAEVMAYARDHGVPVPEVFDVSGPDLVMERIDGDTMGTVLAHHPWRMPAYARVLADVHRLVHAVPGPEWLDHPFGRGDRLVHLDLHPENVLLRDGEPVVIDWTNAATGPGEADVADTWLVMSAARAPGRGPAAVVKAAGQGVFARLFLRAAGGPVDLADLEAGAERRLRDPNMSPRERDRMRRLVERARS